ncbi:CDP-glycerol:glycerophosphate glycerophosphotransferase [Basfia succiniciproducens]|uniref:CDP-glycerol:glycerophosphate glycerophosphotransferase n=1 Tax=Basfia succiniciproducens TaxID=653940 RepID=UPI003FCC81F4
MHIGIWVKQFFCAINISDKKAHTNYTREHSMDINFIKQKTRKALRDPKWAIKRTLTLCKDIYTRKKIKYRKYLPIKYSGHYEYTVVSAVYNVEKYLDEYFDSLVSQTLDFKKHIQLILVDDGSTDSSAAIIKKWQEKYPDNIHYYYKENGGQASARNLGLQHVKTEWVTFIDPDDFLSPDYFYNVDNTAFNDTSLNAIVTSLHFYIEATNSIKDTHPLNYRFKQKNKKYPILDLDQNLNMSASSTIFKSKYIKQYSILFDHNVKPNFEDAKFIADYFLHTKMGFIYFQGASVYYYRKREDGNSTLDTSWTRVEQYSNVLEYGLLRMLQDYYDDLGYIPVHIQRTIIYNISWYIKYLLNQPDRLSFLSENLELNFYQLIKKLFSFIDDKEILDFNLAGMWFFHKVGMLGAFKDSRPESQITYIENIDREKQQILLSFFTYHEVNLSFRLNGIDTIPAFDKNTLYSFGHEYFVTERRCWVPFESKDSVLNVIIDNKNARISLKGKQHKSGLKVQHILDAFKYADKYVSDDSWILMDRDVQADDNAEHLYRYIMQHDPNQQCYFVLNRDSHDWDRLEKDGFNLIPYGTSEFEEKLRNSSKIISSHLDRYINNYFGDEYQYSKKFVFLQHGITKDDMSNWFNSKKNLQCIITATTPEYHSMADNNNRYKLTKKEVVLTGFPRHDKLLANNRYDQKIILIMPTWRQSIVGNTIGNGNARELNSDFMQTEYAQHWYSFLHNSELKMLAEKYGYKVIFAPHANIAPYLSVFNVPNYIEIWSAQSSNESMQELFQKATLMVTDYSSVAFEMAILDKLVVYYQFDKDTAFSGAHIYSPGYFSYEKDGFGPVVYDELELLHKLESILSGDSPLIEVYKDRIQKTFPLRDGNSCERVYQAIKALDQRDSHCLDIEILSDYVKSAYKQQDWETLKSRSQLLVEYGDEEQKAYAKKCQLAIFLKDKNDNSLLSSNILDDIHSLCIEQYKTDQDILLFYAQALVEYRHWNKLLELSDLLDDDKVKTYYLVLAYYYLGNVKKAHEIYAKPDDESEYKYWRLILELALAINDDELKTYCLNGMIRLYPEESIQENIHILCNLLIK